VALRAAVEEELKKLRVSDEKPEKKGKGDDSLKLVTCYEMRSTTRHPGIGAWLLKYKGRLNENLPGSVCIAGGSRVIGGAGFFESAFEPLAISDPESGLRNSKITPGITGERFDSRLSLANDLDQEFRARYDLKRVRAYALMFDGSAS